MEVISLPFILDTSLKKVLSTYTIDDLEKEDVLAM